MNTRNHNTIVGDQFSPMAQSYLTSAVHANGADLEHMCQLVGERPGGIALDLGCGGGHVAFRLAPLVNKVVAYDLSPAMLAVVDEEAQRRGLHNIVVKQGAAESLTCPSESFDMVATRYSAHHWHDVPAGLKQMRRVMKADGQAIFMDVIAPDNPLFDTTLQSLELLRDPSHVRNLSLAQWQHALSVAGFTVKTITKYRLQLEFDSWIKRMKTPASHVTAIRSLQQQAGKEVSEYFDIKADGSFTVDTVLITAAAT